MSSGVVTYMSPLEVFASEIKIFERQIFCAWSIDCLLLKLLIVWFVTSQRSNCSCTSWSFNFRSLEATLIPWLALKKGFDRLIQFWSQSQMLLHRTYKWLATRCPNIWFFLQPSWLVRYFSSTFIDHHSSYSKQFPIVSTAVLSLQVPQMLEPGLVQRTPPPVKPKPRTVKRVEVHEACHINILVLLNRIWVVKRSPALSTQLLHLLSKCMINTSVMFKFPIKGLVVPLMFVWSFFVL